MTTREERTQAVRAKILEMFVLFGEENDIDRMRAYFNLFAREIRSATACILAIDHVCSTETFGKLPPPGTIVEAAKELCGMNHERYLDGRYLGKPKRWPPSGKSWTPVAGEVKEIAAVTQKQLGLLLTPGGDDDESI